MSGRGVISCLQMTAVAALLAACEHPPEWRQGVNAWIGRDADDLVRAWGVPSATYEFQKDGKAIEYRYHATEHSGGETHCYERKGKLECYTIPATTIQYDCKVSFRTNRHNIITFGDYAGDYGGCHTLFRRFGLKFG